MFPPCREVSATLTPAHLGFPPKVLDGLGELRHVPLELAADLGRIPVGPSSLHEGPAGERVAGCGEAALAAAFAPGGLTGGESPRAHERSRVLATGEVAERSDEGDGHHELEAAHGLERLDDGGQAPSLDLLPAFGLETLEPCLMCRNGAAVLLEAHRLGGRGTDHFRQPAPMGGPPGGAALIPAVLAPQEGLQPVLGGLAIPDRLRTRAGPVADRLVLDRRDRDRRQSTGPHQPGELGGVASIGVDAVARLLRDPGGGHDPAEPCRAAEIAIKPGPAGPSFVDEDQRLGFRGELADTRVEVALAGADGARLAGFGVDVTEEAVVRELVEKILAQHGRLDVLVNTVGGYAGGTKLWELETKAFDQMLALNLRSGYVLSRAAVGAMLKKGRGAIINVASKAAIDHAAGAAAYATSKSAAVALLDSLAADLKGSGIRVNSILPSIIDTEANRKAMPAADFSKWPKPEEIARVILFLCSDDASVIRGAAIPVYGDS